MCQPGAISQRWRSLAAKDYRRDEHVHFVHQPEAQQLKVERPATLDQDPRHAHVAQRAHRPCQIDTTVTDGENLHTLATECRDDVRAITRRVTDRRPRITLLLTECRP